MGRIRMVKPEFWQHRGLVKLERLTGLPMRLGYMALWSQCDREGRFRWQPDVLKLNCMPWEDIDFGLILKALAAFDFIGHYQLRTREARDANALDEPETFGFVRSWKKHQSPNVKETPSILPDPSNDTKYVEITETWDTREARDTQRVAIATDTRLLPARVKGMEYKGMEEASSRIIEKTRADTESTANGKPTIRDLMNVIQMNARQKWGNGVTLSFGRMTKEDGIEMIERWIAMGVTVEMAGLVAQDRFEKPDSPVPFSYLDKAFEEAVAKAKEAVVAEYADSGLIDPATAWKRFRGREVNYVLPDTFRPIEDIVWRAAIQASLRGGYNYGEFGPPPDSKLECLWPPHMVEEWKVERDKMRAEDDARRERDMMARQNPAKIALTVVK